VKQNATHPATFCFQSHHLVLCQLTCPLRTIYGKKVDWTFYGKQSQRGSIQVRPALSRFESEHIGGCHFEHAQKLHRTRVLHCMCEARSGFDSLFASASDGSVFQTQQQKFVVSYQKTNWH
jgi:hypothetical protein